MFEMVSGRTPRRRRLPQREVWFTDLAGGITEIHASLLTPDAHALDKRLTALASTVCEHDPRNGQQHRADGLGALAAGADRLGCRCDLDHTITYADGGPTHASNPSVTAAPTTC